ncbi:MAG: OmpA family protein [Bauldia sp.]
MPGAPPAAVPPPAPAPEGALITPNNEAQTQAIDTQIAAFVGQPLPAYTPDADAATLRQQLPAFQQLNTQGEAILAQGRVAERDVTALAERVAEIQQIIVTISTRIATLEGAPAAAPPPNPVVEQLAAAGDAAGAQQVQTLRTELLNQLLTLGAERLLGPQTQPQQPGMALQPLPPPTTTPPPQFGVVVGTQGDRTVFLQGDEYQVRRTQTEELDRLLYGANDVQVEDLGNGYTRTTIFRPDGSQVQTVTDGVGQVIERIRFEADGTQIVLVENTGIVQQLPPNTPPVDFTQTLPVLQVAIPQQEYIVDAGTVTRDQIIAALVAPPVEVVERAYTIEEIRYSDRLRDKLRRVDLTTITFDTGSAAIHPSQFAALTEIGLAIEAILQQAPYSVFLIEGHADAVGSDYSNLLLSDRRAATIAVALSQNFNIPPENLVTQGYGERFLKIPTLGPERQNRRGVIRNITWLLAGAAG